MVMTCEEKSSKFKQRNYSVTTSIQNEHIEKDIYVEYTNVCDEWLSYDLMFHFLLQQFSRLAGSAIQFSF
jgi:hypothetical protein